MSEKKNALTTWADIPPVTERPADCWLRVLIHGLFISAFGGEKTSPYLEIGSLYAPPPRHTLDLSLFDREDEHPIQCFTKGINHRSTIELQVKDGGDLMQYATGGRERFDLNWVADFEGPEFYADKCEKMPAKLGPRLYVFNGVVYTAIRSYVLKKVTNGDFRRITQVLAVDIASGTDFTLVIDGNKVPPICNDGRKYNLVFRNDCGHECDGTSVPTGASDFNYLFTAFAPPYSGGHTIEISADGDYSEECQNKLVDRDIADLGGSGKEAREYLRGLDEVFFSRPLSRFDPCGTGFFGSSTGLDG